MTEEIDYNEVVLTGWGDAYSDPSKLGLTILGGVSASLSYEFDKIVVWKGHDGQLYWAKDSGCSCPSPFENYKRLSDLEKLTNENYAEFQTTVESFVAGYKDGYEKQDLSADATELLSEVSKHLQ